jgi:hypothetical protein
VRPAINGEARVTGTPRVEEAVRQLKGVFQKLPDMQMTESDAAELTGLESHVCGLILGALADARFLRQHGHGVYVHRSAESLDA